MKKRVFNLLILLFAFTATFNVFSQRKVETTKLIVKSAKNAKVLGTDETGRVIDASNLLENDKGYIISSQTDLMANGAAYTYGYSKGQIKLTNGSNIIEGIATSFNSGKYDFKSLFYSWEIYLFLENVGIVKIDINDVISDTEAVISEVNVIGVDDGLVTSWQYASGTYNYYAYPISIASGSNYIFGGLNYSIDSKLGFIAGNNNSTNGSRNVIFGDQNYINIGHSNSIFGTNNRISGTGLGMNNVFIAGNYLEPSSLYETVLGRYNNTAIEKTGLPWDLSEHLLTVGNGTSDSNRSDAFIITKGGRISAPSFDMAQITGSKDLVTLEKLQSELSNIGRINSIVAGTNVLIDDHDPANPIINVLGSPTPSLQEVTDAGNTTLNDIEFTNDKTPSKTTITSSSVHISNYAPQEESSYLDNDELAFSKGLYKVRFTPPLETLTANHTVSMPRKNGTLAITSDIPVYQAGTNVAIDNTDPSNPIINVNGGINSTDLTFVPGSTQGTVKSSNGNDAVIPQANLTDAGLMRAGFEAITTETVAATMIAHQDNAINGAGSFALNDPNIKVDYTKTGRLKRMTFNVGISYTSLEPTDVGDWIVKVPLTIHGSAGEGAKLPLIGYFSSPDTFDSAFKKTDAFSCKGYFSTNSGEIILKIKLNGSAISSGQSGVNSFQFNLVYRTDS
ncbi:hypothetical protein [Tenacibaculum caenipelagi]|uniref:Uncharacterized protein n=1 Tax=Tenacibaculum caenipelagi TaxID=1325435 RepID=A0A4R6TB66_9FLAO|nr:hypothetical protein [Tenacibaculum caenipelagi]TDQ22744.1 hypothetical protein DFQ07_2762 [Tenacibaculum caenipelagi]